MVEGAAGDAVTDGPPLSTRGRRSDGVMTKTGERLLKLLNLARARDPHLQHRLAARAVGGRVQVVVFTGEATRPVLVSVDAPDFEGADGMMR